MRRLQVWPIIYGKIGQGTSLSLICLQIFPFFVDFDQRQVIFIVLDVDSSHYLSRLFVDDLEVVSLSTFFSFSELTYGQLTLA